MALSVKGSQATALRVHHVYTGPWVSTNTITTANRYAPSREPACAPVRRWWESVIEVGSGPGTSGLIGGVALVNGFRLSSVDAGPQLVALFDCALRSTHGT